MCRIKVIGQDNLIETVHGKKPYIFFDNASSTPCLEPVFKKISTFLPYYSNVERGIGYKSFVSTEMLERARDAVHSYVGATDEHSVVFVKNATEAINKLARKVKIVLGDCEVIVTEMEHHSNFLPWKKNFLSHVLTVNDDGRIELDKLEFMLKNRKGKIKIVAMTGASNVTGFANPVYEAANIVHKYGAMVAVDGAQLVPHKKVDMSTKIDFLSFSAHKFYAPFGTGVLVGRKDILSKGDPESVGGGTIKFVSLDEIVWADLSEREEAGTPDIVGSVALMGVIEAIGKWGVDKMEDAEEELHNKLYEVLSKVEGIRMLGGERKKGDMPVISFVSEKMSPYLLSSILSFEYGIGVRTGFFCAQPYMQRMLHLNKKEVEELKNILSSGGRTEKGAIRVSLGFYNTADEIMVLREALEDALSRNNINYSYDTRLRSWVPGGFTFKMPKV